MDIKTFQFLLIYQGIVLVFTNNLNCEPVVEIGESRIIGHSVQFQNYEVYQYLGIPYAEPPIGELRFMSTVPISQQPKELNAVKQPPACMQYTEKPFPWYENPSDMSEDCLYLNIWAPSDACPIHKKAVMYWMHGGGFRYGSIQSKLYNGTVLAALGDIVVVTVNYRMGPFGFLFSSSDHAPGNAGLWDVLEGLKWINKNIGFFGGDSSRITISGESAGAMFISLLSTSPLAKGLYSKQIMESGSAIFLQMDTMRQQNLNNSQKIAEIAKCANGTYTIQDYPGPVVECLKRVDPMVLSKADFLALPDSTVLLWPQYGDKIVPINPRIAVFQGNFGCTNTLIGSTKDEGSYVLTTQNPKIFGFFGEKNPQINKTFGTYLIRDILTGVLDVESIAQHYLSDYVSENAYNFIRHQVYTSFTDEFFLCPSVYYAEKCAEKGNEVYFFKWRHRPSVTPWAPWMGVAHFAEVQFVFGQPLLNSSSYEAEEILLSSEVLNIWSSFVKTGKPRIPWPLYSIESPSLKYLGPGTRIETKDHGTCISECEFFRPFFTPK